MKNIIMATKEVKGGIAVEIICDNWRSEEMVKEVAYTISHDVYAKVFNYIDFPLSEPEIEIIKEIIGTANNIIDDMYIKTK